MKLALVLKVLSLLICSVAWCGPLEDQDIHMITKVLRKLNLREISPTSPNVKCWIDDHCLRALEEGRLSASEIVSFCNRTEHNGEVSLTSVPETNRNKYFTLPMIKGELERDKQNEIRYITPEEREKYKVVIAGGKLLDAYGRPLSGHLLYVMDSDGTIYSGLKADQASAVHSQYKAGGEVAGAGLMLVTNGVLMEIDNESGHYRPNKIAFKQVLDELASKGVKPKKVTHVQDNLR